MSLENLNLAELKLGEDEKKKISKKAKSRRKIKKP